MYVGAEHFEVPFHESFEDPLGVQISKIFFANSLTKLLLLFLLRQLSALFSMIFFLKRDLFILI